MGKATVTQGKRCRKCGVLKVISDFHKNCNASDGHLNICIACAKLYSIAHREQTAAQVRNWNRAHPGRAVRSQQRYRQRHPEIPHWNELNPERARVWQVEYTASHRESRRETIRVGRSRRRARKHNAMGSYTLAEANALLVSQDYLCANPYCCVDLRTVLKAIDHIVALAKGGSNFIANMQYLCVPCNARKHTLSQAEWLAREARRAARRLLSSV